MRACMCEGVFDGAKVVNIHHLWSKSIYEGNCELVCVMLARFER